MRIEPIIGLHNSSMTDVMVVDFLSVGLTCVANDASTYTYMVHSHTQTTGAVNPTHW